MSRQRICWALLLLAGGMLAGGGPAGAQSAAAEPSEETSGPSELQDLNLESFDQVWTTIRDMHWDPELGGLDWAAARGELRPRVAAAATMAEARAVIEELISRLGQSHFAILPGDIYDDLDPASDDEAGGSAETGIELRIIDDVAVVTTVRPGSPAAAAGVQPGWIIQAIAGQEVAPHLTRLQETGGGGLGWQMLAVTSLRTRLQGQAGDTRLVRFVLNHEETRDIALALAEEEGKVQLGYLPLMSVHFESRRLEDNIGYINFNAFLDPAEVMPRFAEAVQSFITLEADGIIIDVRGNPGGIGAMAMGMSGWFIRDKGRQLGTMSTRESRLSFVVFPRARTFDGPLAVLVDGLSASTAEIFAGGLQGLGRARIFGSRSAGMALPSRVDRLANGDAFQYAFASYTSVGGETLEGHGVIPDQEVLLTRQALLAGNDPVLAAARRWITTLSAAPAAPPDEPSAPAAQPQS